ncbi:MAG: uridylate kinase [Methanothrix sp.]|nr:uridylate kinase [Methanothrix sp.]
MPFYVLKIGGSLMGCARQLMRALSELVQEGYSFLVVPGGGPMADLVREIQGRQGISDEAAHWMAILAMEQYALLLADGTGFGLTKRVGRVRGIEILLPYQALQEDDCGLEHSWEYTSDAVAALVAQRLDAPLIKATDVDGVLLDGALAEVLPASSLLGMRSCIDQGALRLLLEGRRDAWVLNGSDPRRFVSMVRAGRGGTLILGE